MLDAAEREVAALPEDSFEHSFVRLTRRDYERVIRTPQSFTRRFFAHTSDSYSAWAQARQDDDFERVRPYLETTLELSLERAAFETPFAHPADPLIAQSDYGMTVAQLKPLFTSLRERLVPLVQRIREQDKPDDSFLRQHYPEAAQFAFAAARAAEFGYNFTRGRLDKTHHPFAIEFSIDDVRITSRANEHYLPEALFCTFHESGHGMYHQGLDPRFEGTPLDGTSAGVHESQSRLWENLVGRSLTFWDYAYPKLQDVFPDNLKGVTLERFYRAINTVEPSLIRTKADEVTYNLHVIIRIELECELLEGTLAVRDLPAAWREKYRDFLGVEVTDDKDGVLQDVHWFSREVGGAFQGYTLGNLLSAQFYEAALRDCPDIPTQIGRGDFRALYGWTRENIHQHGRVYDPDTLIRRICGEPLSGEPYLRYLETKYGQIYAEV